jgi:predicted RNase H-like HicB family nuclease
MKYAVVIETGETSYGAYVPDLPGCVAVAETVDSKKRSSFI